MALFIAATGVFFSGPSPASSPAPAKVGVPLRLTIPKIDVDAKIEHVGLTPEGAMDVPQHPRNAAWFDRGPRPGATGSSVIDGHFDSEDGSPAVFSDLHTLEVGDKVHVEDAEGTTITFIVRESRRYDPDADATKVFRSHGTGAHLNLITCAGTWNTSEQRYSSRLVVFTDRAP
ncbi:MAG: class F sortase [bacterium]|nr:class F sortase [bacterium]